MASEDQRAVALDLLRTVDAYRSQASLTEQAEECVPIVETMGYYDLADHLQRMAGWPTSDRG